MRNNFRTDLHEICRMVGNGPMNKRLNFGDDPDHGSESGYRYPDRERDTSKTCLGGNMNCLSASG